MKYTKMTDFVNIERADLERFLTVAITQIRDILNSGLNFSDNMSGKIIEAQFYQSNTDTVIPHTLGRVPGSYMVRGASAGITPFDGSNQRVDWTDKVIVLRSTGVGSVTLYLE